MILCKCMHICVNRVNNKFGRNIVTSIFESHFSPISKSHMAYL